MTVCSENRRNQHSDRRVYCGVLAPTCWIRRRERTSIQWDDSEKESIERWITKKDKNYHPRHATPYQAMPCHTVQHHAVPCHATVRLRLYVVVYWTEHGSCLILPALHRLHLLVKLVIEHLLVFSRLWSGIGQGNFADIMHRFDSAVNVIEHKLPVVTGCSTQNKYICLVNCTILRYSISESTENWENIRVKSRRWNDDIDNDKQNLR